MPWTIRRTNISGLVSRDLIRAIWTLRSDGVSTSMLLLQEQMLRWLPARVLRVSVGAFQPFLDPILRLYMLAPIFLYEVVWQLLRGLRYLALDILERTLQVISAALLARHAAGRIQVASLRAENVVVFQEEEGNV